MRLNHGCVALSATLTSTSTSILPEVAIVPILVRGFILKPKMDARVFTRHCGLRHLT